MIIISITLFCATASINILGESIGFSEDWKAVFHQNGLNGGLLGHLISYPLSRLIGFIGSYILYATIVIIGVILSANITLYDIASVFKGKFNKPNKKVKNKE